MALIIGSRRKKTFAVATVASLIAVILAGVNVNLTEKAGPSKRTPSADEFPIPPENFRTTTRERDNNEPSVAINPTDPLNIVTGSNDYNTPNLDSWVGYSVTHDGGKTWTEDFIPGYPDGPSSELTGFQGAGDPVIVAADDGVFYYAGIAFKRARSQYNPIGFGWNPGEDNCVFVARSDDGGDTWTPVVVWSALSSLVRFNDKEWVAVDPNNSNNVYLVWAIFTMMATARVMLSRSTDGGQTWSRPVTISENQNAEFNIQGSAIIVDDDANVHVTWIDFSSNMIRYSVSSDQGQTWSTPKDISDIVPIPRALPNANYRTPTMTMSDVDRSGTNTTGSLYVTWADYREGNSDVMLAYSHDNGGSWKGPVKVNNDTTSNDQFFPAVSVSKEGWVHVSFMDRRSDPNNTLYQYWAAVSFDGGETFMINYPMSSESSDGDLSRTNDNDFVGDYSGIDSVNTTLSAVWCDVRQSTTEKGNTEIYAVIFDYEATFRAHAKEWGVEIPVIQSETQ